MNDADIQLIETMRVDPGPSLPLLPWHRKRLEASCAALGYRWPGERLFMDIGRLSAGLDPTSSHRLRLLVDRNGVYSLTFGPLPPTPEPVQLRLDTRPRKAEQLYLAHKSTYRPWYEEAQEWLAVHPNVFDVIFCNAHGEVCEGSRSNIYVQDDEGNWLTPPVSCGLLPGVMRQSLLDQGLVREARISRDDLENAPALRVSNALRGWLTARLIRATTRWR
ncbi:aminotransferase [Pusillimonas sp. TS35]|uniref:aminotransferase class IV n=1 Tax=Paracandidimonas lactea TaxID=2895524 RepID=UPI0013697025|nr:aminotransferase class IV [Paracandidimonas lactea]MYN14579.1 aminotransferase [Pusillimonas sp. TS35]